MSSDQHKVVVTQRFFDTETVAYLSPPDTLYGKLVAGHTVLRLDEENVLLYADLHVLNEYTSPQAFAGLRARGIRVAACNPYIRAPFSTVSLMRE